MSFASENSYKLAKLFITDRSRRIIAAFMNLKTGVDEHFNGFS